MSQQERILCAANWYPDLRFPYPQEGLPSRHWLPQNIEKGIVFSGRHHLQCMWQAYQMTGLRQNQLNELQGFLTSHNRWVSRKEGARIAFEAGQIEKPKNQLYSEDFDHPYPPYKQNLGAKDYGELLK